MTDKYAKHPFNITCYDAGHRHGHDYKPPPDTTQRCACGSRAWTLKTGGLTPPSVGCASCGSANRTATAYERGRASVVADITRAGTS